jgi:N-methylhydantoinase A
MLAGPGSDDSEQAVERFIASFHAAHEQAYGHHSEEEPTQFVNLRVEGIGTVPRGAWSEHIVPRYEHDRRRPVYVKGEGWTEAPVLDRSRLVPDTPYPGPLVVEQHDTTTWIPPGDVATVDASGSIVVVVPQ